MIYVIATVRVTAGQTERFLNEFRQIIPAVLAEQGCLFYGPTIDLETNLTRQIPLRQDVVTIVESWESLENLEAHLVAPHMILYRERVQSLVLGTDLQVLSPV